MQKQAVHDRSSNTKRCAIAERTRDKIHAARKKGKWTDGTMPFGYDLEAGKLRVNDLEAVVVREIFALYLKHRSLVRILEALCERGRTTKATGLASGQGLDERRGAAHPAKSPLCGPDLGGR